jgi:hypothetical protein
LACVWSYWKYDTVITHTFLDRYEQRHALIAFLSVNKSN